MINKKGEIGLFANYIKNKPISSHYCSIQSPFHRLFRQSSNNLNHLIKLHKKYRIIWLHQFMIARKIRFAFAEAHKLQEYSLKPLDSSHKTKALNFVQQQFFQSQPSELAFYKQFPQQKAKSYLYWDRVNRLYANELFQRGLSFGCFDAESGELISAILSKDYAFTVAKDAYPEEGSFLYAVRRLKERMMAGVTPEYYCLVNEVDGEEARMMEMWFAAVHPLHRNKGLLRRMMLTLEDVGAVKSYQYIFSWATNVGTAACYKRLGYQKISEIDVSEFEDNGVRYFREIEPEQRFQSFWVKALSKPTGMEGEKI